MLPENNSYYLINFCLLVNYSGFSPPTSGLDVQNIVVLDCILNVIICKYSRIDGDMRLYLVSEAKEIKYNCVRKLTTLNKLKINSVIICFIF